MITEDYWDRVLPFWFLYGKFSDFDDWGFQITVGGFSETTLLGMTVKWNEKQRRRVQSSFRNTTRLHNRASTLNSQVNTRKSNELWASELRYLASIDRYFDTDWLRGVSYAFISDSICTKQPQNLSSRILGAACFACFEACSEACRLQASPACFVKLAASFVGLQYQSLFRSRVKKMFFEAQLVQSHLEI